MALAVAEDRFVFRGGMAGTSRERLASAGAADDSAAKRWEVLAAKHQLAEPDVNQLVSCGMRTATWDESSNA